MAEKICQVMPSIELVRMVSSGTEATMSAIRLARGFTGRDTIVKFEGCYHGHSDSLLVKAGSGALTLGVPSSPGVPAGLAEHTMTLTYNDIDEVREAFKKHAGFDIPASAQRPAGEAVGALKKLCKAYAHTMVPYLKRVEKVLAQTGPRTRKGTQLFKVDHDYCMCCHSNMATNNECAVCHQD